MKDRKQHLKFVKLVKRLEASYAVGGKDALCKMSVIEAHVLYAEKMCDLSLVSKKLHQYPHDEVGRLRKEKLEIEIGEIAGWMKANQLKGREREIDLER